MTILQIVTFTASSKYLAQPKNVMKEALDALESGEGCASVFHGLQIEDGKTVYIFSLWESEEQYESFAGGAGHFSILAGIKTAAASYPKVHYLSTGLSAVDLIPAFSAPITEFGLWTLKPDVSPKDAELVQGFEELKTGPDGTAGAHPPALWLLVRVVRGMLCWLSGGLRLMRTCKPSRKGLN
ncbi:hypothetical protein FB45DRAFT_1061736 [Roridomyces roridus]|uniref:ABM domain-containing protein n=1 Tax=Roridomyces roridus TaxID=1738132 RepID=A0AAD7BI85_9AGAR|nr:hypothetical protein FB45DRAFT_1061736 [Roridomyces roridus]